MNRFLDTRRWNVSDNYCKGFPAISYPRSSCEPAANQSSEWGRFHIILLGCLCSHSLGQLVWRWQSNTRGCQNDQVVGDFLLLPRWSLGKLAIMRLVKPARWGEAQSKSKGAFGGLVGWISLAFKEITLAVKEQLYPVGSGQHRPSRLLPVLQSSITSSINNLMMNGFNWGFIAFAQPLVCFSPTLFYTGSLFAFQNNFRSIWILIARGITWINLTATVTTA